MIARRYRTIKVSERGDVITSSATDSLHELTVLTRDPTARIVVIDEKFNAVDKGAGSLVKRLPAGFYKVRVQRGASSLGFEDKLVVLDRDRTVVIDPPAFVSPAPIGGSGVNDAHVAAREWLDAVTHLNIGKGAKIAFLARYAAPAQGSRSLIHPFCGLELLRADGQRLVDLVSAMPTPYVPATKDPISICGIQVDPGAYILRHSLADGRQLAQSIIATKGWQITINIRRAEQDADPKQRTFAQVGYLAFLTRRLVNDQSAAAAVIRDSQDGPIDEDKLIDVARQSLADSTRLLSGNLYDLYLRNFENPLIGIFGGLLLDLERETLGDKFAPERAALFDEVVNKLRSMVGHQHPDVEALSFRCVDAAAHRGGISAQPMFYSSWRIILQAAATRPGLVPLEIWKKSLAAGAMPPYLIWLEGAARQSRLRQLTKEAADLSLRRVPVIEDRAQSPELEKPASGQPSPASESVEGPSSTPLAGLATRSTGAMGQAATSPRKKRLSQEHIALRMHVPANALFQLLAAGRTQRSPKEAASRGAKKAAPKRVGTAKRTIKESGKVSTRSKRHPSAKARKARADGRVRPAAKRK